MTEIQYYKPDPIPKFEGANAQYFIQNYQQAKKDKSEEDYKQSMLGLHNTQTQLEQAKLDSYSKEAPLKQAAERSKLIMDKLNQDKGFKEKQVAMIASLNPDSPTFDEDVVKMAQNGQKDLIQNYGVDPETAASIWEEPLKNGTINRESVRFVQEKQGLRRPDRKQIVDGKIVDMDSATSSPISGFVPEPKTELGKKVQDIRSGYYTESDPALIALNPNMEKYGIKLMDSFRKDSNDFVTVKDSYGRIKISSEDPSPAGDMSVLFNYMKMLDPNSVVRESEYATAQNAGSIPERVRAKYNAAINGEKLSDTMRKDFTSMSEKLYKQAEESQAKRTKEYESKAKSYGLPADLVTMDLYATKESKQKDSGGKSSSLITVKNPKTGEMETWDTSTEQRVK